MPKRNLDSTFSREISTFFSRSEIRVVLAYAIEYSPILGQWRVSDSKRTRSDRQSMEITARETLLRIAEKSRAFPSPGALVYDFLNDTVYRLTRNYGGGSIFRTGMPGRNYSFMYATEIGSASDLSKEEWERVEPVGVGICGS
jgi:hypothetical protein